MGDVRWSRKALSDLDAIGRYLEKVSPQYARTIVARLYSSVEVLREFPHLGRQVPEVEVTHIREIIRDGYRIVYIEVASGVEMLAVLHSRQDLIKKLQKGD